MRTPNTQIMDYNPVIALRIKVVLNNMNRMAVQILRYFPGGNLSSFALKAIFRFTLSISCQQTLNVLPALRESEMDEHLLVNIVLKGFPGKL